MGAASGSKPPDPQLSPPKPLSRDHAMARAILTLALLALGIWMLRGLLVPLIWATILAFASWPLYRRFVEALSDRGWGELVPPIAFTLLVGLIFLIPLALVALEFARDAPNVARLVTSIEQKGLGAPDWVSRIPLAGTYIFDWWNTNLSDPRAATELLGRLNKSVFVYWVSSLGTQVLYRLTDLLFTLLTLFFLYRQGAGVAGQLRSFANVVLGESADRLIEHTLLAIRGAVNGLVLVGFGEGFVLGVFYAICGVPHPVILGALTGIVAAIPFGVFVMFALAAIILLVQSSPLAAGLLMVIGIAVLIVADYFVRPIMVGRAAKLPFLWVLFGILGGLESFGLLGLFLGPALLACLLSLWHEVAAERGAI